MCFMLFVNWCYLFFDMLFLYRMGIITQYFKKVLNTLMLQFILVSYHTSFFNLSLIFACQYLLNTTFLWQSIMWLLEIELCEVEPHCPVLNVCYTVVVINGHCVIIVWLKLTFTFLTRISQLHTDWLKSIFLNAWNIKRTLLIAQFFRIFQL